MIMRRRGCGVRSEEEDDEEDSSVHRFLCLVLLTH